MALLDRLLGGLTNVRGLCCLVLRKLRKQVPLLTVHYKYLLSNASAYVIELQDSSKLPPDAVTWMRGRQQIVRISPTHRTADTLQGTEYPAAVFPLGAQLIRLGDLDVVGVSRSPRAHRPPRAFLLAPRCRHSRRTAAS